MEVKTFVAFDRHGITPSMNELDTEVNSFGDAKVAEIGPKASFCFVVHSLTDTDYVNANGHHFFRRVVVYSINRR